MCETTKWAHDSVLFYMSDFSSRIVAKSGLPSDRYHLGKLIFQGLQDDPDYISQINGADDVTETNESVLLRTIKCAIAMQKLGLKKGDVIIIMAPNHLDLAIPMYAAFYLGVIVAALDYTLGIKELHNYFSVDEPKIVFCQAAKVETAQAALTKSEVDSRIISFDDNADCLNFKDFLQVLDDEVKDFKLADFDPEETIAMLTSTSGSTGLPKSISTTHKNLAIALPYLWTSHTKFPTPTKLVVVLSPLQWLSAVFHYILSPILKFTRLQTPEPITEDVFQRLVNKYRPTYAILSPTLLKSVWKVGDTKCDMTCFETIWIGGSAVPEGLCEDVKKINPGIKTAARYGFSEVTGAAFYDQFQKKGSVGKPLGCLSYKLVNPDTLEEINEPNVKGELWLQGPAVCKGYYKCPEVTAETFLEDGWCRSGDIFYRDEDWNFYFVERMKLYLKYKNHQISPLELEEVIREHPGVLDVAVVGLPDPECGELPVAFIVPKQNHVVTAQEIKDIVKESLTDSKHLRGGVIFIKELPMTSTTKIHRRQLKEMVLVMDRE